MSVRFSVLQSIYSKLFKTVNNNKDIYLLHYCCTLMYQLPYLICISLVCVITYSKCSFTTSDPQLESSYKSNMISVSHCVCVCVPLSLLRDLANRWNDMVLLYDVVSHRSWEVLQIF